MLAVEYVLFACSVFVVCVYACLEYVLFAVVVFVVHRVGTVCMLVVCVYACL